MNIDALIDDLGSDAQAVRPVRAKDGRLAAGVAAVGTVAFVLGFLGIRPQLVTGVADAITLLMVALMTLLAIAAGLTATRMAQPSVGGAQGGAPWVFGAVLLFPAISIVQHLFGHAESSQAALGVQCLLLGIAASIFTAVVLTMHLRRGAPVMPEKAGLLVGLSAGAVGTVALTLECGGSTFSHLAFWHVGIVAAWAAIGRFGISRLVRW